MTTPPPKAVIFDLLTALLDSWSLWNACAGTPAVGRRWRASYLLLTYSCGAYEPYEQLVARAALATPGLPPTAAATLLQRWDELAPWSEAPGVLQRLRSAGVRIAVVTNCSAALGSRAARRCGVPFDAVLTAEQVGFYKPRAECYEAALQALGLRAHEAVFVAGSAADVPGAMGVGMRVLWHNRVGLAGLDGCVPEREARDLEELLDGVV